MAAKDDEAADRARIEAAERDRKLNELKRVQELQKELDRRHKSDQN